MIDLWVLSLSGKTQTPAMMSLEDVVTIGIDSSTKNCGVAVFKNGVLETTGNFEFEGIYSLEKLRDIVLTFKDFFSRHKPLIVLMEEPVPVRNGRAVTSLNQVAGAILAMAWESGADTVDFVNNQTIKKTFEYETKEEAIALAKGLGARDNITEHEADAILIVETYERIIRANSY